METTTHIRRIESWLLKVGERTAKMSAAEKVIHQNLNKRPELQEVVEDLCALYNVVPGTSPEKPILMYDSRSIVKFCQIATDHGPESAVNEQSVSAAYAFIQDIGLPKYCVNLKALARIISGEGAHFRNTGIFGLDEPLTVLANLSKTGERRPDKSQLSLFREAWDQICFVHMVDWEIDETGGDDGPIVDIEGKWREEDSDQYWEERVDWNDVYDKGDLLREWCRCFSGPGTNDRGKSTTRTIFFSTYHAWGYTAWSAIEKRKHLSAKQL